MTRYEPSRESLESRAVPGWFRDAKLGVIVHWGPYSVPGWAHLRPPGAGPMAPGATEEWYVDNTYAEWYWNSMSIENSPTARHHEEVWDGRPYERFAKDFVEASAGWDPGPWVDLFVAGGARYVVFTAKHADGFLLWPSARPHPTRPAWQTERDLVGDLAGAVRAAGLVMGLYYCGGLDWSFTGLPVRSIADVVAAVPQSEEYAAYADAHWRELIERYAPSVLWNDIGWPAVGDYHRLFVDYYERVPDGVVNDRFDFLGVLTGAAHSDFRTPEYVQLDDTVEFVWETVRGFGDSFGYNRAEREDDVASVDELVHRLVDVVAKNGNLLLGVGPEAVGTIPDLQARRLEGLGAWLHVNGDAIYRTRPWRWPSAQTGEGLEVRFTQRDGQLFAVILGTPEGHEVVIRDLELRSGSTVELLGREGTIAHRATPAGLAIEVGWLLPSPAYSLRIAPLPDR